MSPYDRLKELGLSLPEVAAPAAAFVPFVRTGGLVFVSGHIARRDGKPWPGKVGADVSLEDGQRAAKEVTLDLLGALHAAVGDLERVQRIVKLTVLVNSAPGFTDQHLVANGASELLQSVFGAARGAHARAAFGVAELPLGACVEIEMVAEAA